MCEELGYDTKPENGQTEKNCQTKVISPPFISSLISKHEKEEAEIDVGDESCSKFTIKIYAMHRIYNLLKMFLAFLENKH